MIIQHIIIGLLLAAAGFAGVKYTFQLVNFTGHIGFVEDKLGGGSTYGFMKFMSVIVCIGGILYIFGLFDPLARWALSPLSRLLNPGA